MNEKVPNLGDASLRITFANCLHLYRPCQSESRGCSRMQSNQRRYDCIETSRSAGSIAFFSASNRMTDGACRLASSLTWDSSRLCPTAPIVRRLPPLVPSAGHMDG